ncbi:sensor histidine kinase [Nocardioides marmorisolisilvae]|uniref:histidine kinase n=1 Tax=Nocardioides marmorisolisilvae TaxID=1542737 RepID=A0A3N0DTG0_9ACTN|nr:HAMP domain-containing sensor histidine kinase [Nocardioides marmorisolisilvae]RNL78924.1 sensor histidine kinase [Nocardioides marmorisolisilvae]
MTPWHRSIRLRVAATMLLLACLSSAVNGFVVDAQVAPAARSQLRVQALDELRVATATYDLTGRAPLGSSVSPGAVPADLVAAIRPGQASTEYDGQVMWAALRRPDGVVLSVQVPDAGIRAQRKGLHAALIASAALVALIGAVLGWQVAGSLTLRLRQAAQRFGSSGPEDGSDGDEVSALVNRVEGLTAALRTRLDREREFSADVAHELRTPMTALVSAAELLPEGDANDLVRRQIARLRRLVEDLLELARAERDVHGELEHADLAVIAAQVTSEFRGVDLVVRGSVAVHLDPIAVDRIVANLVGNALRHGRSPVTVEVEHKTIRVSDHGNGFPEALIASGPQRFAAHGPTAGSGLGLSICAALAERSGAHLVLVNGTHGAVASVVWD